jgi:hypothetical protein
LSGGFIALPGDSFDVLLFDARTGDAQIANATGFAGLDFTKTYSSSSLTLAASATGGDANLDGSVNLLDFNILAASFGQSGLNWLSGDFTGDSMVGLADFDVLAAHFGQSLAGQELTPEMWATLASAVPEPFAILPVVALGIFSHRRRIMR